MDPYSPFAPACVRVLVLPVGQVERATFLDVLGRLQEEAAIVALADILPFPDGDDVFLHAPNASSRGSLLYDYTTSAPSEPEQQLSPFELFREPLLVIGIVDGLNFSPQDGVKQLEEAASYISKRHPRVVNRELMLLGVAGDSHVQASETANIVYVDRQPEINGASLTDGVRKISSRFLKELSIYTKAMQVSPSIQTPGQTARSLQRTTSPRDSERRPGSNSGQSTPTPSQSNDAMSPVDDIGSRPPPWNRSSPATSFDQIPGALNTAAGLSRSDSRTSTRGKSAARASSQDRVAVQGFGSSTSQDKLKQRGKARVGLVVGSIYMMAGQWSEALRMLTEHTNKARLLGDHIWHGKGLDNIVVCLLLHSWAGMEYQIPSICYLTSDKATQRFSVNVASDSKSTDPAQRASVRSLSTTLPELAKLVFSLYRGGEGSLDLPPVSIAEATVRFSKTLAALHISNGPLDRSALNRLVGRQKPHDFAKFTTPARLASNSSAASFKAAISEMLSQVVATGLDNVADSSQVGILAGIASVYALVGMERKKGMAMRLLVTKLGECLEQAVKQRDFATSKSSAQHPAQVDATVHGFQLDVLNMDGLITELGRIYGLPLISSDSTETREEAAGHDIDFPGFFGSNALKVGILRELMHLFGVEPEKPWMSASYFRLLASFLRTMGPYGAMDTYGTITPSDWAEDVPRGIYEARWYLEQAGQKCPDLEIPYWDPFLVRGVRFESLEGPLRVCQRSVKTSLLATEDTSDAPGNPLLYDPSASRPGTAEKPKQSELVVGEESKCLVRLQNPYDAIMQIEHIGFDSHDIDLETASQSFELEPMRLQIVVVCCTPRAAGAFTVNGLSIKVRGARVQKFPIMEAPWMPQRRLVVKAMGQDVLRAENTAENMPTNVPTGESVSIVVAEAQPLLTVEKSAITGSAIMLLAGEQRSLTISLKNVSSLPAVMLQVKGLERVLRYLPESDAAVANSTSPDSKQGLEESDLMQPGEIKSFEFTALCSAGSYRGELRFLYGRVDKDNKGARVLNVPLNMSVIETLQIKHLDILPSHSLDGLGGNDTGGDGCILCFEVVNTQSNSISFTCGFTDPARDSRQTNTYTSPSETGSIAGHSAKRILLPISRLREDETFLDMDKATAIVKERLWMIWHYNGREGAVDTSNLKITPIALQNLLTAPMHLTLAVLESNSADLPSHWTCKCGSFATIRAKLTNHSAPSEPLFMHMQALPDDRRLTITGTAKRFVAPVAKGESRVVDFGVCPMLAGNVEMAVSVAAALPVEKGGRGGQVVHGSLKMVVT